MSLYGMMRTSVSGMNSLAARLSTVADNIANSGTYGYKRASAEFSTQVLDGGGKYKSGSVATNIRRAVSQQGSLRATDYVTDLAISGDGFFVVQNGSGDYFLTRAGSFLVDSEGTLINANGETLMGYDLSDPNSSAVANGFSGLVPVSIAANELEAAATTEGTLTANLPSEADTADPTLLPSANVADAEYTAKTSMVVYDDLGNARTVDVYFTKTADETWEVAVYDAADAGDPDTFPYSSGPLATTTLDFDPTTGYLTDTSASSITFTVTGGADMTLDFTGISQLGADYSVLEATANGNAPGSVESVQVSADGIVYGVYDNGFVEALYQLAVAKVPSPDNLTPVSGNLFSVSIDFGRRAGRHRPVAGIRLDRFRRAGGIQCRHRDRADDHDRIAAQLRRQFQGVPDGIRSHGDPDQPAVNHQRPRSGSLTILASAVSQS